LSRSLVSWWVRRASEEGEVKGQEEEKGKRGEGWFIYSRAPGIQAFTSLFPLLTKPVSRVAAEHGDVGGRGKGK